MERNANRDEVALSDLTIWRRRGATNESTIARVRRIRKLNTQVGLHDKLVPAESFEANIAVIPSEGITDSSAEVSPNEPGESVLADGNQPSPLPTEPPSSETKEQLERDEGPPLPPVENGLDESNQSDSSGVNDTPLPGDGEPWRFGTRSTFQREADASEHALSVGDYADVIVNVLDNAGNDERLSFAIFGHWGRGKTFLMSEVAKRLRHRPSVTKHRYSYVNFSAWKYRTTPEVWAFLFQQLLSEARRANWLVGYAAAIARNGVWCAFWALLGLLLALFSLTEKVTFVTWLIRLFGAGGIAYLTFLFLRFQTTAIRLHSLYSISNHVDKLGLQAAIGDDLRSLIEAWIQRPSFKYRSIFRIWIPGVLCVGICALISWKLWPNATEEWRLIAGGNSSAIDPRISATLSIAWSLFWLTPLFRYVVWPLFAGGVSTRILLCIDDLDRCEPDQMLEIIESTMLILDDPEIHSRLQLVMLIDENTLHHALLRKYGYLREKTDCLRDDRFSPDRIIRENREKFFLLHLRLPPLTATEISEVTSKIVNKLSDSPSHPATRNDPTVGPGTNATVEAPEDTRDAEPKDPVRPNIELTQNVIEVYESEAISDAIRSLAEEDEREAIGPRTIRCLIFRYLLARQLLVKLGHERDAILLPTMIVHANSKTSQSVWDESTVLSRVAKQVS